MTFICRSCGGNSHYPVLDLGETPLANALLSQDALGRPEPRYPLRVMFCQDCSLVQITETVAPEILFSDYVYFSSFSDTMVASAKALVERLCRDRGLNSSSLVMEAASNDGYLLRHYAAKGVPVLGIEPAANIAEVAQKAGVRTHCAFFNLAEAQRLAAAGRCDVFHANNVLAHVADLNGFVGGIAAVLKPDGIASIEVPYLRDMIEKIEFDTIYHEHLCYFSVTALEKLFARHGLEIADVERIPLHGGSLRLFVAHQPAQRSAAVAAILKEEDAAGIASKDYYAAFAGRVDELCRDLRSLLKGLTAQGRKIAAYGASAKGATLLNYCGIGRETLEFVVDRSTAKQGKFTPGSQLPILSPQTLLDRRPDHVLLLTWNFADEILSQQEEYRRGGGKFIVPVPDVRIV